ncbi:hypothetical protein EYF80_001190 [Liparis tanakae]|uniref:Uncharacterized protein n=1 Tax=Liparis tanakae TaxID=230148 RepID=A0A4Z2JFM1_9TELE|nr:hypothetical protein EYF80_001190 [Liparis tanakae]
MQQVAGNPDDTRGVGAPHRKRQKPTGPSPEQSVLCLTPTIREMCHLPRSSASLPRSLPHQPNATHQPSYSCQAVGGGKQKRPVFKDAAKTTIGTRSSYDI